MNDIDPSLRLMAKTMDAIDAMFAPKPRSTSNLLAEVDMDLCIGGRRYSGFTVEVMGHYVTGFPGSPETPQERAGAVVDSVLWDGMDIRDRLPEGVLERLSEIANEAE